ncbi:MAG: prepilin-type N-terminal cleavage/methylation domain-containing protein [Methylococcales bacterium]|jgi:type IV fimbrial biogenesis protein FimT|nr:prepilin-type N-terminal cleavage/methylation domain-containing protein [Methylococcales bacterium]MBT7444817.1 prepilin-type N-terminal cleavage/methylation domain-containing protein [Methylococcales bacterium]
MNNDKFHNGFTLLELIISMTIAAILMGIAIPALESFIQNKRLIGAAENVQAQLQHAQSEAIQIGQDVHVVFTDTSPSNWCVGLDVDNTPETPDCNCNTATNCGISAPGSSNRLLFLRSNQFKNVLISNISFGAAAGKTVTFNSVRATAETTLGTARNGSLQLSISNKSMQVNVSRLGRSSVCSDDITGYPAC